MNSLRYQLLLLIVFPLMGLFYSCVKNSPCPAPPETVTKYLGYKDSIPYKGNDTLTFVQTSTGDTHTFIGQGKTQQFTVLQIPRVVDDCPSSGGMERTEEISYKFVSSTFPSPITLGLYYKTFTYDYFYIRFNNQVYERSTTIFDHYVYDSVQVGTKFYHKVRTVSDDDYPNSTEYYALFNTSSGILKFRFKNGEIWELLPK